MHNSAIQDRFSFILEKETVSSIVFFLLAIYITQLKLYVLLACGLIFINYYLSQNSLRAVWSTLVSVALIPQAKYFPEQIFSAKQFLNLGQFPVIYSFFLTISDFLIPLSIYLIYKYRKRLYPHLKPLPSHLLPLIMASVVLLAVISSIQSNFPDISFFNTYLLIKLFSLFLLGKILTRHNPSIQKLTLEIISTSVLINSLIIVIQQFNHGPLGLPLETLNNFSSIGDYSDENPDLYRPSGIFGSPNLSASMISIALVIVISLLKHRKTFNRLLVYVVLGFGSLALIATGSRAAWIITFLLIISMISQKDIIIKKISLKDFLNWKFLSITGMFCILFFNSILPRIISLNQVFEPRGGGFYRLRHFEIANDFLQNYPFGVGVNVFQFEIVRHYNSTYIYADSTPAHNALAEIGSDFGFLGLILFPIMYYIIIKGTYQSTKLSIFNKSIFWALASYLLSIQFHPWLFERPIAEIFWLLSGVIIDDKSS